MSYFNIPNFSHMGFGSIINEPPVNQLTLEDGVFAGFLMLVGLISVFVGYRLFRITLFIAGTFFCYILIFPIILKTGLTNEIAIFGICAGISLACGILLMFVWKLGLFAAGCLIGYIIATYILGIAQGTIIAQPPWTYVFTGGCCLVFGILIFFFKKPLMITSTACLGSYFTFYGLDVFLLGKTGYSAIFDSFLTGNHVTTGMTDETWYMVGGSIGLAIIGIIAQVLSTKKLNVFGSSNNSSQKGKDIETEDDISKAKQGKPVYMNELQSRVTGK